jgi:hypothetical protein
LRRTRRIQSWMALVTCGMTWTVFPERREGVREGGREGGRARNRTRADAFCQGTGPAWECII